MGVVIESLFGEMSYLPTWLFGSTFMFLRYAIFAGVATFIFYYLLRDKIPHKKIQQKYPKMTKVWAEIKHSSHTAIIFGFLGMIIHVLTGNGMTHIYSDFSEYGIIYTLFSFVFIVFFHDAYFYWMHYAMHKIKPLMRFHAIHHKSYNPTPWAAMAFHPIEALVEFAFIPFLVVVMPFHPMVLMLFGMFSFFFNVLGHLGFEVFPKGFTTHPITKWINTSTHHNMHHKNGSANFGLYFNIWDRVMGTNHKNYEETFEEVANRQKEEKVENLAVT